MNCDTLPSPVLLSLSLHSDDPQTTKQGARSHQEIRKIIMEQTEDGSKTANEGDTTAATQTTSSLNDHYGNTIGFLQTFSLLLNAGLMVYAHVGLSGVVYSSRDANQLNSSPSDATIPSLLDPTGACEEMDLQNWISRDGLEGRGYDAQFCALQYQGTGCLLNTACVTECWQSEYGYTADCSECFTALNPCVQNSPCFLVCAAAPLGEECTICREGTTCDADFFNCTGLPEEIDSIGNNTSTGPTMSPTAEDGDDVDTDEDNVEESLEECGFETLDDVVEWYPVYDLTFVGSIRDSWQADVQFLALLIIVFSGIWPYAKNVALVVIWYLPMTDSRRSWSLLWLTRLSKYTLVDVFAVVFVIVGVQLELTVGEATGITRAEARFAIIAFLLATLWEFIQIEWMKIKHDRFLELNKASKGKAEDTTTMEHGNRFGTTVAMLLLTLALYASGASVELFRLENFDLGGRDTGAGCITSYNLGTIIMAVVSELGLIDNLSKGQSWTLFFFALIFALILPVTVHLLQISYLFLARSANNEQLKHTIGNLTGILWGISSVEVFLIGLFAVEYKFEQFIKQLAGDQGAQFIDVETYLGPGFYILLAYSVVAGLLQYYLRIWWLESD